MADARRKKFARETGISVSFLKSHISQPKMLNFPAKCRKGNLPYPPMRQITINNTSYLIPRTKLGRSTYAKVMLNKRPTKKNLQIAARKFKISPDGTSNT